jgi:hypothetical protein
MALRSRSAEGGSKPPHAALAEDRRGVVNMNAEGGLSCVTGFNVLTAVLYGEMEVVWSSGVVLRGMASNRPHLHWLKTVVENVVGKGVTRSRQVGIGKMSDGREPSVVDVSKTVR